MDEERRWDGSNAQWLMRQNVYDILCKAQDMLNSDNNGVLRHCILDYIFDNKSPDGCLNKHGDWSYENCHKCIEGFLYKSHK